MSKRKAQRNKKKLAGPAASSAPKKKEKTSAGSGLLSKILQPRVLATFCFGTAGLLSGLATGLNHFPELGATDEIPRMMLLATYLGDPHPDIPAGMATGFAGLAIGACLGFSAISDPKILGLSILISTFLAIMAFTSTGNLWLVGVAFLFGHVPAFLAALQRKKS